MNLTLRELLYTDGVTKAEARSGDRFGTDRLEATFDSLGRSEPAGTLDAIMGSVERFRGTARRSDDITMMLVSRDGAT